MNRQTATLPLLWLTVSGGCADNLLVPDTNVTPVAVARLLDDDSPTPTVSFKGSPLDLTLDGTRSEDPDGRVQTYRWLSATLAPGPHAGTDAGASMDSDGGPGAAPPAHGRWVPEGADSDWPQDVAQPTVRLPGVGTYGFSLWVIDERGRVSDPSTLTITVVAD